MNELLKPVIVLTVICIITSALLGATYTVTDPLIRAAEKKASDDAMMEVLPSASGFTELSGGKLDELKDAVKETKVGLLLAAKDDGGSGYVFKVQDKGFGGAYVVMVGMDADGKITGTKLLDNSETPGLGSKTGVPDFTDQFKGKGAGLEGVETITGATVSSKTFIRCVETAFEAYESVKEGA